MLSVEAARRSTGLGLAIAKTLTEQMNGDISAIYQNSVFLLSFHLGRIVMKTTTKILIAVGAFLLLLLITWGICETAGSDYYNYKGYVVDIVDENGDTVIVTLLGDTESRFTLKWYSREKYKKETHDIEVGDLVMLSTTQYSNTNIKKISVDKGYSTEGKIFYTNELPDRPYIFANEPTAGRQLFDLIIFDDDLLEGLNEGDVVKVYYEYGFATNAISVQVNAITKISDGSLDDFTDEEIAYIEEKGYTVKQP